MSTVCPACREPIEGRPLRCPHCGAELAADATSANQPPQEPGRLTARFDATLEFAPLEQPPDDVELPPPPTTPGRGTVIGRTIEFEPPAANAPADQPYDPRKTPALGKFDHTIQFQPEAVRDDAGGANLRFTVANVGAGTVPGPTGHSPLLATVDSAQLSESEAQRLANLWNDAGESPRMTIRGRESRPIDTRSSLVIRSRTLHKGMGAPKVNADYELLEVLGEGGMGVVYLARQASIDRTVAVKMLKGEFAGDREQQHKFLSEAVVTGDLEHPNIVPMYDLGSNDEGALFYAMKRVQGTPWSKVIQEKTQHENLDILLKVADAVAFAHSRGVVHRDLKPENVMLGDFGEVLVMDWGLAYSTPSFRKAGSIVQSNSMGGTPAYMAPEMALGPVDRVSPASDVYLLGAILYEIITGHPPHTGSSITRCLWSAARNEIQPTNKSGELLDIAFQAMSTLPEDRYPSVQQFQAALRAYRSHWESVVLADKADEDLRAARHTGDYRVFSRALFGYEESLAMWTDNARARAGVSTARLEYARTAYEKHDYDLAASLLLDNEPEHQELAVQVRRGQRDRDARQQRLRNVRRLAVGLAAAILVILSVAYVQISAERDRAREAQQLAQTERDNAVAAENRARTAEADALVAADQARVAERQALASAGQARAAEAQARADRDLARQAKEAEEYEAYVARIGLAAARIDENAYGAALDLLEQCPPPMRGWEWERLRFLCGRHAREFSAPAPITSIALEPATAALRVASLDGVVRRFDTADGRLLATLDVGNPNVLSVAVCPQGRLVATGTGDARSPLTIWDAATGERLLAPTGHTDAVHRVRFAHDGRWLISASRDNTARIWDTKTGSLLAMLDGHSWWVWDAAISPDGSLAVTVSQDGTAIVWDVALALARQGDPQLPRPALRLFTAHNGPVLAVDLAADGRTVATAGHDGFVLLWQADQVPEFDFQRAVADEPVAEVPRLTLLGHTAAVHALAFSPDGQRLLSGSHDNTLRLWNTADGSAIKVLRGHGGRVTSCQFAGDGHWVFSGSHDHTARAWNADQYEEQRILPQRVLADHDDAVLSVAFSPDDRSILTSSRDRSAMLWNAATGEVLQQFEEGHAYLASSAVLSRDGRWLATAAVDNSTRLWDLATGTQQLLLSGTGRAAALALSPDGGTILTGSDHRTAILWDTVTGSPLRELPEHAAEVTAVAISADGRWLATGEASGRINVWDSANGRRRHTALYHSRRITGLAFLPDGRRLVSASLDNTVGQFDLEQARELTDRILKHPDGVLSMVLSRDGHQALTACQDGAVRAWDLNSRELLGTPFGPETRANHADWSADGRWILAVSSELREVRLRDVASGRPFRPAGIDASTAPLLDASQLGNLLWSAALSADGTRLVTIGGNSARLWEVASRRTLQTFSPHGVVATASFSPDATRVVTGSWDGSAKVWDVASGRAMVRLAGEHGGHVQTARFLPDGRHLLTAADDGLAILWDTDTGQPVRRFAGHDGPIQAAAISVDGALLLTASLDRTARLWNIASGETVHVLRGHAWHVLACDFSADARQVVTAGGDNRALVWDVETGQMQVEIPGHSAAIVAVAFSPDGRRVLTGGADSLAKLWDARSGKELLTLHGHTQEVTSVAFSHNGHNALTGSSDGTAIIWLATSAAD